jgi:DnaJ-domain-containing protein 1
LSAGVSESAPQFSQNDLRQWKLIADFRARLEALAQAQPHHPAWEDKRRKLQQFDHLSLFLFTLVNPVIASLRAASAASELRRVQQEVCARATSASALSEAQYLLEPALLEQLLASLSEQVQGPTPKDPRAAWQLWLARDSSIFAATHRMFWAQHGAGKVGRHNHAVRFHVSFQLWDEKPARVAVTPGKVCERKVWREQLQPGATYVGDRYFAQDYKMFGHLQALGCYFVLRLSEAAVVQVLEENPVSAAEREGGVISDHWVQLGRRKRHQTGRLRLITLRKPSGTVLRLVSNLGLAEMSARELQTLYRRRWQIECFFRWLKCLLGCRHWLAESPAGVTTQLYLAVIAGLLLQLVLGRRPNQRLWERLQFYLLGWASAEELLQAVAAAVEKAGSKKS